MSDERRLVISTDPSLTPDDIGRRTFGTAFRGWDPNEVKAYLAKVGKELAAAQQRVKQLEREIREVSARANHPELDEATITSALGEEAARILRTAREAAADIKGRAEENAERALRQGQDEAKRIRSEAEAMLADRMKEADEAAEVLRQAAEADGQRIVEEAKAHSREMLHEAQALRAKVLGDLGRRRKLAQVQVAQLRAGRERLLDAYRTVRRTLDEVSDELQRADAEARLAAEQAAVRAADLPEASADELAAGLTNALPPALVEEEPAPEETAAPAAAEAPKEPEQPAAVAAPPPAPTASKPPAPTESSTASPPKQLTKAQRKAERRAEKQRQAQEVAAAPTPSAPPAPVKPAAAQAPAVEMEGERTSSSLRVLRPKPAPTVTTPSGAEMEVVEASSDVETVRVIPAAASPEPAAPEPAVPEKAEIVADKPAEQPPADERAPEVPAPEVPTAEVPAEDEQPEDEEKKPEEPAAEASEPEAEREPEPEAAPKPEAKPKPEPAQPVDDLFARIRADRAEAVAKAQQVLQEATAPAAAPESPESPEKQSAVASIDDGHIRKRDSELQPVEATLSRRLKRGLQDDQNELLDRLRSHRGPITVDAILPPVDEHGERFKQVGRDLLVQAARAGSSFAGRNNGAPSADLSDLVDALADAVIAPLRGRLERGLSDALAEGDDEGVLVERIGAAYREWKSQRIEQLAGDQVMAAFGRGVMSATEPGTPLRWIVRDVGGPCPDCDDNALAGAVPSGETWPTGQVHPPAHPGCRCLLVPAPH